MPEASTHARYVQAVVTELHGLDVAVADVVVESVPLRRGQMTITEPAPAGTESEAEWVRLMWTERQGWSWQVCYEGEQPRVPTYFGLALVPPPRQVATWLVVALRHPGVEPTREAGALDRTNLDKDLLAYTVSVR
ncbi:DUF6292 family protein [Lentzea sp. NPDC092896]|uniref:DUF6292 family protein n=1 Tax=Lentzea sp. NPDC092896 TaxID=3364127 RepID=UPI0037FBC0CA